MKNDCIHIVNIDECSLYHIVCNGCMKCDDYKPSEPCIPNPNTLFEPYGGYKP